MFERIINKLRIQKLRFNKIDISYSALIDKNVSLNLGSPFFGSSAGHISIGDNSKISRGVIFDCYGGTINLGKNVFIGPYTVIYGHGNVTIGNHCLIAMGCKIVAANHSFNKGELINQQPDVKKPIFIGDDVWLGADVKVLAGVTIGNGCVVAAGSVVTKSLPPFSIAIGAPAIVVRTREL